MVDRDDGVLYTKFSGQGDRPAWPWYIRVLAVCYVLSYALQWLAFVGLTGTAAFLYARGHRLDSLVLGLAFSSLGCVLLCIVVRRRFVRWGRKNYPPAS
jgi:hypothetical protein